MSSLPLRASNRLDQIALDPSGPRSNDARRPSGLDRRVEDWVVSYLDDRETSRSVLSFEGWIAEGGVRKANDQLGRRSNATDRVAPRTRCWARIQVQRAGSAILVRILDSLLIKDEVLDELADEFEDLIRAGYRRILLDCSGLQKVSTRLATAIQQLGSACDDGQGGQLRVVGLDAENLEMLRVAGDKGLHSDFADVASALAHPWPTRDPRPLPLSLIGALKYQGDERHEVVDDATYSLGETPRAAVADGFDDEDDDDGVEARLPFFWLIVESSQKNGPARGTVIPVRGERFAIGRGAWSDLRLAHPQVGRDHARIERVGNRTRIVDLGSTLGTIVNGKPLNESAMPLKDGDVVRIGPFVASVLSGHSGTGMGSLEEIVFDWITATPAEDAAAELETSEFAVGDLDVTSVSEYETLASDRRIQWGLIQGVLVITPRIDRLDEESGVEAFRQGLQELLLDPASTRVVLNLSHVTHVSSRWLGVLFACFLRLQQDGGMVRLCELHARVFSVLEQVRLPMLIDVTSTLDEAVIRAWD